MTEIATLGGGCFWCLEAVYDELRGVSVESEVLGRPGPEPDVSPGVPEPRATPRWCRLHFDPEVVSFREILEIFFTIHDPTTLNRQGADVGPQYRSAIFYHDEEQRRVAEDLISDLEAEGVWDNPIVTEVTPFEKFFVAEDYHQEYYRNNAYQPYCQSVSRPRSRSSATVLERLKA